MRFSFGTISAVYPERGTVRVQIQDIDNVITNELQVVFRRTVGDTDYWMPVVGEQVACLFLDSGIETGVVLGSVYSEADTVPVNSADKFYKSFADGSVIEYDKAAHKLSASIVGDIEASAQGDATVTTQGNVTVTAQGDATISASKITASAQSTADITAAASISLTAPLIYLNGQVIASGAIVAGGGLGGPAGGGALSVTSNIDLTGNLQTSGDINAAGSIIDTVANTNHHTHP